VIDVSLQATLPIGIPPSFNLLNVYTTIFQRQTNF